ncbi:hypothetical protein Q4566_15225 [Tamlana sp. 2_MG-2023]|uniref:hypothetical protein n=1 Tax=Tamlana sp. 1_MG-2023 TaxID=3062628 RepID=UPI0026E29F21|nr:hypothetical protein [Tamlana sp. 1_MG-2023]MDO6761562.1 hypothetical protein [Tamlana sp. 2_MG-2023]MDO6792308.1 hypothetical protein [Tamlana sp. 1_MG-2023]
MLGIVTDFNMSYILNLDSQPPKNITTNQNQLMNGLSYTFKKKQMHQKPVNLGHKKTEAYTLRFSIYLYLFTLLKLE